MLVLSLLARAVFAGDLPAEQPAGHPVLVPLGVAPESVDLGLLERGTIGTVELTISNRADRAIRLTYIFAECDCSFVMPDTGSVPAFGNFTLRAMMPTDDLASGKFAEVITILTDHSAQQEIQIPVSASIHNSNQGDHPTRTEG